MPNNNLSNAKEVYDNRRRVVLLVKDSLMAILTLTHASRESTISCCDPRCSVPSVRSFTDPRYARSIFLRTVRSGVRHGWRIFYDGPPLEG